jgi:hypothetical protein
MLTYLNKNVNLKDLIAVMDEQLKAGKKVSFVPRGNSMRPMLHGGTDMIILSKPVGRLHLFDVALYYRQETDAYVVHRVVGFQKDGSYVMLGDNNFQREYNIREEDIIGVVTAFYRKGKMHSVDSLLYRLYNNVWYYTRPMRLLVLKAKAKIRSN